MALKVLYQTKQKSEDSNQMTYKITYQGKESEINTYIASLSIGTTEAEGCYLASWTKSQFGADIYQLQLTYTKSYQWGQYSNVPPTVVGKKSSVLSVRNLSLPVEHLDNYLWCWNHYLIQRANSEDDISVPLWASTLGKDANGDLQLIPQGDQDNYSWIKSLSQRPLGKDAQGKRWYVIQNPIYPGQDFYDFAVFVVTESAKYRSANAAGTAINKNINTITPPSNTFGLNYGNFKLDQSNVFWDGRSWIATSVYSHSPDGWNTDFYGS